MVPPALSALRKCIDWTPFFHTWELKGAYPAILEDPARGTEARRLLEDAERQLDLWEQENTLELRGVFGLFRACSEGETVKLMGEHGEELARLEFLRQQRSRSEGKPLLSLADYVAPDEKGTEDALGLFAVTAGGPFAAAEIEKAEAEGDDYQSILMKSLLDRLAEALAEWLHREVRTKHWGYAPGENATLEDLLRNRYRGIRPAPGYPACPDHTEKRALWELLDVTRNTGIELTESLAMLPASSVCGYYFAHSQARYFGIGNIGKDQVQDYAARKGMPLPEMEKWLAPNLDYNPESD